tara:strand:+ start:270 stop:1547 length:1278 start_codon:yes stop_codon:yes gene_type:complete
MNSSKEIKVGIIGLGYVGLPLAIEFCKKYSVIAFDINNQRIQELLNHNDSTMEVNCKELERAENILYTNTKDDLKSCNVFIVTVPTPIDKENIPDLRPIREASELLGLLIKPGDTVIYESTVYPGVTEEVCVPILEENSSLKINKDFFVGYSPERINPGDKEHRLKDIVKVTSGSNQMTANFVDKLYSSIISAGTHMASSIKVAEAAKVIENTQRDVNIALINELSMIFNKLNIDTQDVLDAAGTKWNFLPFKPGLVGGHCIGVDPFYLTFKAQSIGYNPEIILAGRKINDYMADYVAIKLIDKMKDSKIEIENSNTLILGITFKENCPDIRNTKVVNIIKKLKEYKINVDVLDPHSSEEELLREHDIGLVKQPKNDYYDSVIITVAHDEFRQMNIDQIKNLCKQKSVIYDLKHIFAKDEVDIRL